MLTSGFLWRCNFLTQGVSANMKDKDKVKHLRSDYYCGVGLGKGSNVRLFNWPVSWIMHLLISCIVYHAYMLMISVSCLSLKKFSQSVSCIHLDSMTGFYKNLFNHQYVYHIDHPFMTIIHLTPGEDSGKDRDGIDTGETGQGSSGVVSQAAGPVVIRCIFS